MEKKNTNVIEKSDQLRKDNNFLTMNVHIKLSDVLNVIIAGGLHPPWIDGVTVYSKSIVESLVKANYKVIVISSYDLTLLPLIVSDDLGRWKDFSSKIEIVYLLTEKSPYQIMPKRMFIYSLDKIIKKAGKYTYVVFHIIVPNVDPFLIILLSVLKRLPQNIIMIKYLVTPNPRRPYLLIYSIPSKWQKVFRKLYVTCSSNYVARTFRISHYFLVRPRVDIDFYNPKLIQSEISIKKINRLIENADPLITYIGWGFRERFPWKHIIYALRKLKYKHQMKNVKLLAVIKRSGHRTSNLIYFWDYIKRLGLKDNVVFLQKNLSEFEKIYLLSRSDVFLNLILSPTGFVDPPLSILEALSLNVPVVTTNVTSLATIINQHKYGFALNNINVVKIAECIALCLGKRINSREFIKEKFSMKAQIKDIIHMLKSITFI